MVFKLKKQHKNDFKKIKYKNTQKICTKLLFFGLNSIYIFSDK